MLLPYIGVLVLLGCIYAYPCVFALFTQYNQCRYIFTVLLFRCVDSFAALRWPAVVAGDCLSLFVEEG